jgi:hypothetical protein
MQIVFDELREGLLNDCEELPESLQNICNHQHGIPYPVVKLCIFPQQTLHITSTPPDMPCDRLWGIRFYLEDGSTGPTDQYPDTHRRHIANHPRRNGFGSGWPEHFPAVIW